MRMPRALEVVPWDWAQEEIGVAVSAFLAVLACRMLRLAKDQRSSQVPENSSFEGE